MMDLRATESRPSLTAAGLQAAGLSRVDRPVPAQDLLALPRNRKPRREAGVYVIEQRTLSPLFIVAQAGTSARILGRTFLDE